jgi:hypothetical protein
VLWFIEATPILCSRVRARTGCPLIVTRRSTSSPRRKGVSHLKKSVLGDGEADMIRGRRDVGDHPD